MAHSITHPTEELKFEVDIFIPELNYIDVELVEAYCGISKHINPEQRNEVFVAEQNHISCLSEKY